MKQFPKLFIPGPTFVPDDVLLKMSNPQIGHRTEEMSILISDIVSGIQKLLYTKNHIYLTSHPATGLWELGVKNSTKKKILHIINGAFSSKWAFSSKLLGVDFEILEYNWGDSLDIDEVDNILSKGDIDVVAMVHNETSTGSLTNLNPISDLLKRKYSDIIWLVDAVSSMAGVKIEVDRLGIDFIFSSTQKAWGLPAGFSVCSISKKMIEKSQLIKNKGYFLNVEIYEKYYSKMQTPFTPSIPHMYGLKYVLDLIHREGLEARWSNHIEMANYVRNWAYSHNQELFPKPHCLSETITCIKNIQKWDIERINKELLERGYRMDRGYGKLRGEAFRVSHMGNITLNDIKEYLSNFDEVINV